jgi:hypothetical protein
MINYSLVYIYSDQPTTCPRCGARSEVVLDLSHTNNRTEVHLCLDKYCKYEFIMQYDEDFDNGSLL